MLVCISTNNSMKVCASKVPFYLISLIFICSTSALEINTDTLMHHYFETMLPNLSGVVNTSQWDDAAKLLEEGRKLSSNMSSFATALMCRSLSERRELIDASLKRDRRQLYTDCNCNGRHVNMSSKKRLHKSEVNLNVGKKLMMSENFGMYALGYMSILRLLPYHYPGITTPVLHYGETHTFIPAHTEIMSLNSFNYLHRGHPRVW